MPSDERFDVFVEGVRDGSPEGLTRAATALAPRLAMPADRVARLLGARFRVRTGVDQDLAARLARELEAYGLRVAVAPTGARPIPTAPPGGRPRMATIAWSSPGVPARPRSDPSAEPGQPIAPALPEAVPAPPRRRESPRPAAQASRPAPRGIGPSAQSMRPTGQPVRPARPAPTGPAMFEAGDFPSIGGDDGISIGHLDTIASGTASRTLPESGGGFLPSSFGPPPDASAPPLEIEERPGRSGGAPAAPRPSAGFSDVGNFLPPDAEELPPLELAAPAPGTAKPRTLAPAPAALAAARSTAPPASAPLPRVPTVPPAQRLATRPPAARAGAPAPAGPILRALGVLVVALVVGYLPATLYAQRVDAHQVARLQAEYQDLAVNPWRGEATHRTVETVHREIADLRWNATLAMMGIWAACAGLLGALAYVLL